MRLTVQLLSPLQITMEYLRKNCLLGKNLEAQMHQCHRKNSFPSRKRLSKVITHKPLAMNNIQAFQTKNFSQADVIQTTVP